MAYIPPSSEGEFWEESSKELLEAIEEHGEMSLREIKDSMRSKKVGIKKTVNMLSYLSLTGRVEYSHDKKVWRLTKE